MSYCRSVVLEGQLPLLKEKVRDALKGQGFGVLTEIDMQATLKAKLGHEMGAYLILGACNPELAKGALAVEPRIGLMLPCNVILRELDDGRTEVSAVDPVASMAGVDNDELKQHAALVRDRLNLALDAL